MSHPLPVRLGDGLDLEGRVAGGAGRRPQPWHTRVAAIIGDGVLITLAEDLIVARNIDDGTELWHVDLVPNDVEDEDDVEPRFGLLARMDSGDIIAIGQAVGDSDTLEVEQLDSSGVRFASSHVLSALQDPAQLTFRTLS